MSSAFKWIAVGAIVAAIGAAAVLGLYGVVLRVHALDLLPPPPQDDFDRALLRVCADPNNMPFSNDRGDGFENTLAQIVARDLGRRVEYTWLPQRRGFVRNTLKAGECDVIMGVPSSYELARTTRPYYRSSYVFVSRRDRRLRLRSFDDPRLKRFLIGVHVVGDDYANPPPAQALAARHILRNIRGYPIYGDYSKPDPPRDLIDAVDRGEIDVAVVWGPIGGYFAKQEPIALDVTPVSPQIDLPFLPFVFDISMGVLRRNAGLADELDREIDRRQGDINRLLASYGVPLVDAADGED